MIFSILKFGILCFVTGFGIGLSQSKEVVNITTMEFWLSPDGEDVTDCLSLNTSCKTISYIIQNRCVKNTHLRIQLKGSEKFTYNEPYWENTFETRSNNMSNKIYPCYVTISGRNASHKPHVKFGCNMTSGENPKNVTNVLSALLTLSKSTMDLCHLKQICTHNKLELDNIKVTNLNIQYDGSHRIVAQNVHFDDVTLSGEGNFAKPCHFLCGNCKFTFTIDGNDNRAQNIINFDSCSSSTLIFENTLISSTKLYVSFVFNVYVAITDVIVLSNSGDDTGVTQIILQQLETETFANNTTSSEHLEPTVIFLSNLTITNNNIQANDTSYNAMIGIYLIHSMNYSSKVMFIDSSCTNSSSLLDYRVGRGDTLQFNESNLFQNHSIILQNLKIHGNIGFSEIIRIRNALKSTTTIVGCTFSGNIILNSNFSDDEKSNETHRRAVLSIQIGDGIVDLLDSVFDNNVGILGGALYLSTDPCYPSVFKVQICKFLGNSALNYNDQVSGLGGAIFIQSNIIDLFVKGCTFEGNSAKVSGGAIYFESVKLSSREEATVTSNSTTSTDTASSIQAVDVITTSSFFTTTESLTENQQNHVQINMLNTTFYHNSANEQGGALAFEGISNEIYFYLERVKFQGNFAGKGGGAMTISGDGYIKAIWFGCDFSYNTVNNTKIDYRYQETGGSVLRTNHSVELLKLKDCKINGNVIQGHAYYPGAISITSSLATGVNNFVFNLILDSVKMSHNKFYSDNHSGGGVFNVFLSPGSHILSSIITVTMINCTVVSNTAIRDAGFLTLSIFHESNFGSLRVFIADSTFHDNNCLQGLDSGVLGLSMFNDRGNVTHFNAQLSIINSVFTSNKGAEGGALYLFLQNVNASVTVRGSSFQDNTATSGGAGILIKLSNHDALLNVYLSNVQFIQNVLKEDANELNQDVITSGGALHISTSQSKPGLYYKVSILVAKVRFYNNSAYGDGGAIALILPAASNSNISIVDCIFEGNQAGKLKNGGALYFHFSYNIEEEFLDIIPPRILIRRSVFRNNIAGQGGSVYQSAFNGIYGEMVVVETTFFCCDGQEAQTYAYNSTIFFAYFSTNMTNVSFEEVSDKSLCSLKGLILENGPAAHNSKSLTYRCTKSQVVVYLSPSETHVNKTKGIDQETGYPNIHSPLGSLDVTCTQCTFLPNTVGDGEVKIVDNIPLSTAAEYSECQSDNEHKLCYSYHHYLETRSPCHPCPFGGDCSHNKLKARPNYWGYQLEEFTKFQTCPLGYCCNDIDVPCERYNTCALHRQGRLCGECEPGYTESLMSRTCIPDEECDDWWIWPLAFLLAFSYLIWYMYKGEIMPGLEFLVMKVYSYKLKKRKVVPKNTNYTEFQDTQTHSDIGKEKRIDKGYFDILVYFVNIISLLKVKVEFQSSETGDGFLYNLEKYFIRYLDVDMLQVANVTVCPFAGINATTKSLAKPAFVIMILSIWITLFWITNIYSCYLEGERKPTLKSSNIFS